MMHATARGIDWDRLTDADYEVVAAITEHAAASCHPTPPGHRTYTTTAGDTRCITCAAHTLLPPHPFGHRPRRDPRITKALADALPTRAAVLARAAQTGDQQ